MQRLLVAAVLPFLAISAAAQEPTLLRKPGFPINVMGKTVKGAPYAADEVTESVQVLGDGTRISNQSQVAVYRDGEGRVRRESPRQITIWDPVAGVSYTLDPKNMTATKSSMVQAVYSAPGSDKSMIEFALISGVNTEISPARQRGNTEAQMAVITQDLDKLKAELKASADVMVVNGAPASPQTAAVIEDQLKVAMEKLSRSPANNTRNEVLGQKVIQGLTADGTRATTTIESGAIGNDRPIQVVSERWYSAELQTAVMTTHSDPRSGEETFHLSNVRRGEPGADLFMMPPGYQLVDVVHRILLDNPTKKEE